LLTLAPKENVKLGLKSDSEIEFSLKSCLIKQDFQIDLKMLNFAFLLMRMTRRREHFHICKYARRYDKREGKFIIDIAYETATEITPRTIGVAEAFGLGIDKHEKFVLYDNAQFKIGLTDVVYITGDSGSGKSVLLRQMKKDLGEEALDMADIQVDPDKPLIDTIGKTFSEGLELLSRAGLNDAFLFVRRFRELSDGQKYRYKIAKLMESGKQWWIADEFCSTLDRDTAKIVAFNMQKLARKSGKAIIVATTHTDLFEDLKPSVHIHKRFGKEITVNHYPNELNRECSLIKEVRIEVGSVADYRKLSVFHYRTSHCPAPRKIFILKREDQLCGVIVYSWSPPNTFGRRKVWKGTFKEMQKELSTITRVIVHPKYRTIGLGIKLVKESLPKAPTPCVETIAVMARYNPFFEKAGMQKIAESKPNPNVLKAIEQLCQIGFNPIMLGSVNYNKQKIKEVDREEVQRILIHFCKKEGALRKRLLSFHKVYPKQAQAEARIKDASTELLAKMIKRLNFLAQTKVYLFWKKGS
jgi:ABC-type transport system involved in cytochrome c biogenesis ATPase subunit/predicted N-acetyltransferase YhbS